jgi:hypothetical protein
LHTLNNLFPAIARSVVAEFDAGAATRRLHAYVMQPRSFYKRRGVVRIYLGQVWEGYKLTTE